MGKYVQAGQLRVWTEQVGEGPDVLLIGGLGDTVESWQPQLDGLADRYRLTAFDNRGAGRTAMPAEPPTVEAMADDAAEVLGALGIESAHVAGFSGGSIISQELALRHPSLVRSLVLQSTWSAMDPYLKALTGALHWQLERAPDARSFLDYFFLLVYTPRAYNSGRVEQIIDEVLAFEHPQSDEDFLKFLDAFTGHETTGRLGSIRVPTLVLAGGIDPMSRPELGRAVADGIPGALFEVMAGESHQPFQEIPDVWNARVHDFWQDADRKHSGTTWS